MWGSHVEQVLGLPTSQRPLTLCANMVPHSGPRFDSPSASVLNQYHKRFALSVDEDALAHVSYLLEILRLALVLHGLV
jgi:hypothetical protein